jgi:hypothetical protein
VAVGSAAGIGVTTASNVISIGAGVAGFNVDNSCFIGNIRNALVAPDAVAVLVDSFGKLGTMITSNRFNEEITPIGKASEALYALVPVAFHYKKEIDSKSIPQFGLIAEDVEQVNPDLIVRDKQGQPYSVRYDQVNAMLLNEFLKEHRKNEEQQATIVGLKATVSQQQKQIEILTAGLQKVSAQLELNRPARQLVNEP